MRRALTPSIWVWLALAVVGLAILISRPSRPAHAPAPPAPEAAESLSLTPDQRTAAAVWTTPSPPAPETPDPEQRPTLVLVPDPALDQLLRATLGSAADQYAVVVKRLGEETGTAINADRVFYAASLFKLTVMYEAFHQDASGQLRLDTRLTVTEEAIAEDLGTLELWSFDMGDEVSVQELVELMVTASDNTASALLRDALGRPAIDATMGTLGLEATSVSSPELPTTAADMALLLESIATGQAVNETASRAMMQLLLDQWVRDRIPAGVPPDVPVANKTGNWETATHDAAIVYAPTGTYLLVVLSDQQGDEGIIAEISRQIYAYYAGPVR